MVAPTDEDGEQKDENALYYDTSEELHDSRGIAIDAATRHGVTEKTILHTHARIQTHTNTDDGEAVLKIYLLHNI